MAGRSCPVRGGNGDIIRGLSTPGAWPLAPPVVILAGGSSGAVDERMRGYAAVVREAMMGWEGTIVSGGTRQGVSALAGDLGETGARVIGYLPTVVPDDVAVDDDPRRYAELRRSDGASFGAREPIRYWSDVVASGIEPGAVRLIALAGGTISALEYRLAIALGARVGAIPRQRGCGNGAPSTLDLVRLRSRGGTRTGVRLDPRIPELLTRCDLKRQGLNRMMNTSDAPANRCCTTPGEVGKSRDVVYPGIVTMPESPSANPAPLLPSLLEPPR